MIRVVNPQLGETLYDGACGSAGFLCEAYDYLQAQNKLNLADQAYNAFTAFEDAHPGSMVRIAPDDTRSKLLRGLAEKGFGRAQLDEMQKIIDAEKSDLFDVLAYVAYALPTLSREERAANADGKIRTRFGTKQQIFLAFVLSQYVQVGVDELDQEKLSSLLKLKYHNAIADAVADLGEPHQIRGMFADFQKFLYQVAS